MHIQCCPHKKYGQANRGVRGLYFSSFRFLCNYFTLIWVSHIDQGFFLLVTMTLTHSASDLLVFNFHSGISNLLSTVLAPGHASLSQVQTKALQLSTSGRKAIPFPEKINCLE